ncbi:ArnB [Desulforapulum autotrophicum HRM2]|uniref:ArnB n=1 Tax=Desulforapulum autotrophicum (strain ATCC 43914 / DSM 3382 / VKM B-1955 / HRM2) TaxID=177437 RepID=C0QA12_DESAH|nr:UDP-4-amino-4,6-dideoxy-N-acetyl-beta-L-altrosamine transaminase [Desulforapulum autotrophicum]ACN16730.1 ArnB [Desulforapulum autotrophicum HRM2]
MISQKSAENYIPYGRQSIDEEDIQAVVNILKSDWLTTGPQIEKFEKAFCSFTNANEAVAVSSGTAALHAAMNAINIQPGDEVIVPPMTFAATANAVVYQGGTPVFADVLPDTLLINPEEVKKKITSRTKAIIAVDYAGQSCDYDALRFISDKHKLYLITDACHALGGRYKGRKIGSLADLTLFSFHPVKHITTGEGGMITCSDSTLAAKMKTFRNHGITTDQHRRSMEGTWYYEMESLGYNYRITDIQCALGLSQLKKLDGWIKNRNWIARKYDKAFSEEESISPLKVMKEMVHAYHLYVIKLPDRKLRDTVYKEMHRHNIGVNVHYIPVHLHPYYRKTFNTSQGLCPVAEDAFQRILSLPMHPKINNTDIKRIVTELTNAIEKNR